MENKFTTKAKEIHGDLYDYSCWKPKTWGCKSDILCILHGVFVQSPSSHLRGRGCPECGRVKIGLAAKASLSVERARSQGYKTKYDTESWVKAAKTIHPQYDYMKAVYVDYRTKITVTCLKHGDFLIKPSKHIAKTAHGCQKCSLNSALIRLEEMKKSQRSCYGGYKPRRGVLICRFGSIPYRSSYEERFIKKCALNKNILHLCAEPLTVLVNDTKRYKPDFALDFVDGKREIVEVKPSIFVNTKDYALRFSMARAFLSSFEIVFAIVTEKDLF